MQLILSRHGNTFGPGDQVVWTGKTNDLPLVKKGVEQAKHFAAALVKHAVQPKAIYCSPLQRTHQYAQIILEQMRLSFEPIIDHRLSELDYGEWTGLTDEEVIARFGKEAYEVWNNASKWPLKGNWGSTEHNTVQEVHAFSQEIANTYGKEDRVIAISSNGRLRYFLTLVQNEFKRRIESRTFKVKTGHLGSLVYQNNLFSVKYWNINPDKMNLAQLT